MQDKITNYIRAGFAGLYLLTHEEVRAEAELKQLADDLGYTLFSWTVTQGLLNTGNGNVEAILDPVDAINAVSEIPEKSILVLNDFHQFLGDAGQPASPLITRSLKEKVREARTAGKVIIILGCSLGLPIEIEKEFTVIEYELPGSKVLAVIAESIAESAHIKVPEQDIEKAAEAAQGLTTQEAEDIFALSVVQTKSLQPQLIAKEKAKAVKKSGLLEIIEPKETINDIGGLDNLKDWLLKRKNAFTKEAVEYGLPAPKGVLILGIPGTGKSLTAKAAASILERPILKLDAGKLFAGIVGESEANLRRAIQTAEAIAPCILYIDELEKAFAGSKSSSFTDGGTSARVFGSFLNWLQDKTSPVFVVATANDVSQLPPELLRKGRWDETFFVDLPSQKERETIWSIQIGKYGRKPADFDLTALAKATDGFTGSEIEQLFIEALYLAFDEQAEVAEQHISKAVENAVPLGKLMKEGISSLRQWAKGRTRQASVGDENKTTTRKLAA